MSDTQADVAPERAAEGDGDNWGPIAAVVDAVREATALADHLHAKTGGLMVVEPEALGALACAALFPRIPKSKSNALLLAEVCAAVFSARLEELGDGNVVSDNSAIEWTDATWNPVRGCTKVSAGCKHCYAETFAERWRGVMIKGKDGVDKPHAFFQGFDLRLVPEMLSKPLLWTRGRKIFVNSMSDLFHEEVPFEYIAACFGVMAACPQHTFQVLTKRPERALAFYEWLEQQAEACMLMFPHWTLPWRRGHMMRAGLLRATDAETLYQHGVDTIESFVAEWPLPNVHLGVSCEDQENADLRIPLLRACPAAVRFVSLEPLLGAIDLVPWIGPCCPDHPDGCPHAAGLDWVIVGGESGPGARLCHITWIRLIVEQCKAAGVPVFVKQLGARPTGNWNPALKENVGGPFRTESSKGGDIAEFPEDLRVREFPQVRE